MRAFITLGLILSASATASSPTLDTYAVTGISRLNPVNTAALHTTTYDVYVRCDSRIFDDTTRDRVAGFDTVGECEEFLNTLEKFASSARPVQVTINSKLGLEVKVNF